MNIRTILKYAFGLSLGFVIFVIHHEHKQTYELEKFRRSDGEFARGVMPYKPSKLGLDSLYISGSARPTKEGLECALATMGMPVVVFDLFGDEHYYINGLPESWFGYKKSTEVGLEPKKINIRGLAHRLVYTGKLSHDQKDAQTEKEMVNDLGFNYVIVDQIRKTIPTDDQVEEFIKTVDALPNPVWIHFHCSAGRGRTTVAMVMYDILKNGENVSLEDIIARHQLLGSENLFDTTVWPNGRYTKEMLEDRKQFIINFYNYVKSPDGFGIKTWKEWIGAKT
jgi:protein tyrosine phosphatase (PTP) superfamily phosphohydrolase (DUF442 family)